MIYYGFGWPLVTKIYDKIMYFEQKKFEFSIFSFYLFSSKFDLPGQFGWIQWNARLKLIQNGIENVPKIGLEVDFWTHRGQENKRKQRETWQLRWLWTFASTRKMKSERARRSQSWGRRSARGEGGARFFALTADCASLSRSSSFSSMQRSIAISLSMFCVVNGRFKTILFDKNYSFDNPGSIQHKEFI